LRSPRTWICRIRKPGRAGFRLTQGFFHYGSLDIVNTSNAGSPLTGNDKPLLTRNIWEPACYIDYRNARPKYIESFLKPVNWNFVAQNLSAA
jgi:superoxide dismutase